MSKVKKRQNIKGALLATGVLATGAVLGYTVSKHFFKHDKPPEPEKPIELVTGVEDGVTCMEYTAQMVKKVNEYAGTFKFNIISSAMGGSEIKDPFSAAVLWCIIQSLKLMGHTVKDRASPDFVARVSNFVVFNVTTFKAWKGQTFSNEIAHVLPIQEILNHCFGEKKYIEWKEPGNITDNVQIIIDKGDKDNTWNTYIRDTLDEKKWFMNTWEKGKKPTGQVSVDDLNEDKNYHTVFMVAQKSIAPSETVTAVSESSPPVPIMERIAELFNSIAPVKAPEPKTSSGSVTALEPETSSGSVTALEPETSSGSVTASETPSENSISQSFGKLFQRIKKEVEKVGEDSWDKEPETRSGRFVTESPDEFKILENFRPISDPLGYKNW